MTFSKEAKIGILTAAALIIFFIGFYFLKGTSLFYDFEEYTCYYDNVQGLQNSSLVQIKGFSVGKVASISLAILCASDATFGSFFSFSLGI